MLVFAIVFLSGCTASEKEKEQASKILQEYINNIDKTCKDKTGISDFYSEFLK